MCTHTSVTLTTVISLHKAMVTAAARTILSGSGRQETRHSAHPSGITWGRCRWPPSTEGTLRLTAGFLSLLYRKETLEKSVISYRSPTAPISVSLRLPLIFLRMVLDSGLIPTHPISV